MNDLPPFHDIKPLPEFYPGGFPWLLCILGAALILTALFLWRRFKRQAADASLAPDEEADQALDELERLCMGRQVSAREFTARLSGILRRFFEQVLGFPAAEQTAQELQESLAKALSGELPHLSTDERQRIVREVMEILRFSERVTFGHDTDEQMLEDALTTIGASRSAVEKVTEWLRVEAARAEQTGDESP